MSRPTAAVTNRYQKKAFDRITVIVPKGQKARVKAYAEERWETINSLVNRLLMVETGQTLEEWKTRTPDTDDEP